MKKVITKSITIITMLAIVLTMAMPMTAQAKTKVALNKTKATLTLTDSKPNPAVALKLKGTSRKVTWSSSNKKIATVKNGKVTAKKKGTVKITAKVSGKKYTCRITVKDKLSKINKTKATLEITNAKTAPTVQLKVTGNRATWTTSDKAVASVKNGKVTAKKKGSATITAKIGKRKLTCKVTVTDSRTTAPTPVDNKCKHEYKNLTVNFMGNEVENAAAWKLVYHEGLDGCVSHKNGNFTEFNGCGHCNIIYKDGNTSSKIGTMKNAQKVFGTFEGCDHTSAIIACQPNNDECPMPTGYWFVATKQCTKCGAYAE